MQLDVPMAGAGIDPRLRLRSPLDGVAIALPAPLRKSADDSLPIDLQMGLGAAATAIDMRLGQLLRMKAESGGAPGAFRGMVNFGGDEFSLPPRGLRVRGQVAVLASAEWVAQALGQGSDGFEIESIDVRAGALDIADRSFGETRVRLQRNSDAAWQVDLDGESLSGALQLPANPLVAPIRAQFQRLYWPAGLPDGGDAGAAPSSIEPGTRHGCPVSAQRVPARSGCPAGKARVAPLRCTKPFRVVPSGSTSVSCCTRLCEIS